MAYDSTNKKIYVDTSAAKGGITPWDIAQCIGDYRVTKFGRSIGMLCTSPNINPYARFKPEDYPTTAPITDAQRKANGYGFGNTAKTFRAGYSTAQHAVYEYKKPKGGVSSPFRMLDFNGYFHKAASPLSLIFPDKIYNDWANGFSVRANDTGVTNYDPAYCVKLGDVMVANDDMYVALYIFKDGNNQWLLPTSVTVNSLSSSTFPQIVFASLESELPSRSGNVYPYVIPELANHKDSSYTVIAVGVSGLVYQTDKKPYALSGDKLIGNRDLYSMELVENADRKTIVVSKAKTIADLVGSFTMNVSPATYHSLVGGYSCYTLSGVTSSLMLTTPADWHFTNGETIRVEVSVNNQNGYIYPLNSTTATELKFTAAPVVDEANKTYTISDLLANIGNYRFQNQGGSLATEIGLFVKINILSPSGDESKEIYSNTIYVTIP